MKTIAHPNTQTNPNQHVSPLNSYMRQEKFEKLFCETPERTSPSPSGLHIGQYKAIFSDPDLAQVETLAINIPFQYGFSYKRWQNSTHIMLKKEALPYIHQLRIIQLFEADFNASLKILYSHRMMPHGDKNNFSGEQAQGAQKGRTPQDLIINLQYTAINSAVTRTPISYCFNDQKGNFDKIRHNSNGVLQRRMGMSKEATLTTTKTLSHMKHKIRTAHGLSKGYISPSLEMVGSGQDSGHGSASNHVQSVPIINSLSQMTKGSFMIDPTGSRKNKQHAVGWIDNVTLKESSHPTITYRQMLISITTT